MAREIIWDVNWRGERALSAEDFIRQREALSPTRITVPSSFETVRSNAPGVQMCTNGALTEELCEGGNSAPIKFPIVIVPPKPRSPRFRR